MKSRMLGMAVALALTASAPAAAGCNLKTFAGYWLVQVSDVSWDVQGGFGPYSGQDLCWFNLSKRTARVAAVEIDCASASSFAPGQLDFPDTAPEHELVDPVKTSGQCSWTLIDRSELDTEYTVNFSSDGRYFEGHGNGFWDKYFGSTEPFVTFFRGIRLVGTGPVSLPWQLVQPRPQ